MSSPIPEHIKTHVRKLRDDDAAARRKAIIALGKTGDSAALKFLAWSAKNDPDPALQTLAKKAAQHIQLQQKNAPVAESSQASTTVATSATPALDAPPEMQRRLGRSEPSTWDYILGILLTVSVLGFIPALTAPLIEMDDLLLSSGDTFGEVMADAAAATGISGDSEPLVFRYVSRFLNGQSSPSEWLFTEAQLASGTQLPSGMIDDPAQYQLYSLAMYLPGIGPLFYIFAGAGLIGLLMGLQRSFAGIGRLLLGVLGVYGMWITVILTALIGLGAFIFFWLVTSTIFIEAVLDALDLSAQPFFGFNYAGSGLWGSIVYFVVVIVIAVFAIFMRRRRNRI